MSLACIFMTFDCISSLKFLNAGLFFSSTPMLCFSLFDILVNPIKDYELVII